MTIEEAAKELDKKLRPHLWYTTCGVRSQTLVVYVSKRIKKELVPTIFEGYPVTSTFVGKITPGAENA